VLVTFLDRFRFNGANMHFGLQHIFLDSAGVCGVP
jgi:hypothetical protein